MTSLHAASIAATVTAVRAVLDDLDAQRVDLLDLLGRLERFAGDTVQPRLPLSPKEQAAADRRDAAYRTGTRKKAKAATRASAARKARTARAKATPKPKAARLEDRLVAAVTEPKPTGAWDAKILANLALAPAAGATVKDIVVGVAGKSYSEKQYQAIWQACRSLSGRGLIRKDGRHYYPAPAEE